MTDDVARVGAGAGSVTEAATNALPDLPVPIETPDVPKVPVPAPAPPPLPSVSKSPPPSASTPSAPSAAETAEATVHGPGGGAEEGSGGAARVPSEAEEEAGASPAPGAHDEPGARAVTGKPGQRSIGPAETAPLRRWRAYVWPAIALRVREALMPLLNRLDFGGVQVPDVFGLLSPSAAPDPAAPRSVGVDLPSGRPDPPGQELRSPAGGVLPEAGMGLLAALLIGLLTATGLVALARLVVGEELFEIQYWRGHRG